MPRFCWRVRAALVAAAVSTFPVVGAGQGTVPIRAVVQTGEQASGVPQGAVFTDLDTPIINDVGQVVFGATIQGGGVTSLNNTGTWVGRAGEPTSLRVRKGQAFPEVGPGVTLFGLQDPAILNNDGQVAYRAILQGGGLSGDHRIAVVLADQSGSTVVARRGTPIPGHPSVTFGLNGQSLAFSGLALGSGGRIAFSSYLTDPAQPGGFPNATFVGTPGNLAVTARQLQPAPGMPDGVNILWANAIPRISRSGDVSYSTTLYGAGVGEHNDVMYYGVGADGVPRPLVREGDQAPGFPAGVTLGTMFLAYGAKGQLSVYGPTSTGVWGIWTGQPSNLTLMAMPGGAAPGFAPGVTFHTYGRGLASNGGRILFEANLLGPGIDWSQNSSTVWSRGADGSLTLVAQTRGPAPGAGEGVTFAAAPIVETFNSNDLGQLAWLAQLEGPGVTAANDRAIYAFDPFEGVFPVVREGDVLDLGDGVSKQVLHLLLATELQGVQTLQKNILGDDGSLAFRAIFTDGSRAILVASIPSPGTALSGVLIAVVAARRGRRR